MFEQAIEHGRCGNPRTKNKHFHGKFLFFFFFKNAQIFFLLKIFFVGKGLVIFSKNILQQQNVCIGDGTREVREVLHKKRTLLNNYYVLLYKYDL